MNVSNYLSEKFFIPEDRLRGYVMTAPYRYKKYFIPKRDGVGKRLIAQPTSELKLLQLVALDVFQDKLPVHACAMAYRSGLSIKDNAACHAKNQYLLKMDFKDFFHSIKAEDFSSHISRYIGEVDEAQNEFIQRLFFWAEKRGVGLCLSIGAPSSPFISNTVMYGFDLKVSSLCEALGVVYTRYADDLTFSTGSKGVLLDFPQRVSDVCNSLDYPSLKVNSEKTVFSSKKSNRHVTGLVLNNDGCVSLGRHKKRFIKSMIFRYACSKLTDDESKSLSGLLAFARHVEPKFYISLIEKYGFRVVDELVRK